MSKNLLTKFRVFWRTLSPLEQRRLYDIMTALRGEDGGNDSLKYRTTARIRGLLFGIKLKDGATGGLMGFFRSDPSIDRTSAQKDLFYKASVHWQGHIRDALRALKPYVKKGRFKDLLRFMRKK